MGILNSDTPKFGCGTGIFFLEHEELFFPACKLHDIEYDEKGPQLSRKVSDRLFLERMRHTAKEKKELRNYVRAILYFIIVRMFGGIYYKKKNYYSDQQLAEYTKVVDEYFNYPI